MKTNILVLVLTGVMAGTTWVSCTETQEKDKTVKEASSDLKKENEERAEEAKRSEEWNLFKEDAKRKIEENEKRVVELKETMRKKDAKIREKYNEKIEKIEKKNAELNKKIAEYKDDGNEKWTSFKREFKHDMDELNSAVEDIFQDNVK